MPGVIIITTMVMMLAYGSSEGLYTGGAYEGISFFPWVGEQLSFVVTPLLGFTDPQAIAFPVTSLGSVGAAISMVPQFLESGIIDAKGICVFTAIGICNAGFLSTHVGMMDGIKERRLTNVAIATHFFGGMCAGAFGHALFLLLGWSSPRRHKHPPRTRLSLSDIRGGPWQTCSCRFRFPPTRSQVAADPPDAPGFVGTCPCRPLPPASP